MQGYQVGDQGELHGCMRGYEHVYLLGSERHAAPYLSCLGRKRLESPGSDIYVDGRAWRGVCTLHGQLGLEN